MAEIGLIPIESHSSHLAQSRHAVRCAGQRRDLSGLKIPDTLGKKDDSNYCSCRSTDHGWECNSQEVFWNVISSQWVEELCKISLVPWSKLSPSPKWEDAQPMCYTLVLQHISHLHRLTPTASPQQKQRTACGWRETESTSGLHGLCIQSAVCNMSAQGGRHRTVHLAHQGWVASEITPAGFLRQRRV